jgi:ribulose bisphosphate carboxylase small subunit
MNEDIIRKFGDDTSSTAQFTLELFTMNGALSSAQRVAVAQIVQRVCTGLSTQMSMLLPEGYEIKLEHKSSRRGKSELDIG